MMRRERRFLGCLARRFRDFWPLIRFRHLPEQGAGLPQGLRVVHRQRPDFLHVPLQGLYVALQAADEGADGLFGRVGHATLQTGPDGLLRVGAGTQAGGELCLHVVRQPGDPARIDEESRPAKLSSIGLCSTARFPCSASSWWTHTSISCQPSSVAAQLPWWPQTSALPDRILDGSSRRRSSISVRFSRTNEFT
jgi:hypothetical protein